MKKSIFLIAVLAALVLTGLGLRYYGLPAYRKHKETRLVQQTQEFMARKDYRNASITARQLRALNPEKLEGLRASAELAELSGSPQAVDARRKIAELRPTVENKVMLASTAMKFQGRPYPLATQVLEELRQAGTTDAVYHAVAAELALHKNQGEIAMQEYEAASRAEPTNQLHALNLAVLRLGSTNQTEAAEARTRLEELGASPPLAVHAWRWLTSDAMERNDLPRAKHYSSELLKCSNTIDDRLLHLAILEKAADAEMGGFLSTLQQTAATNASEIYRVCKWMAGHRQVEEGMSWFTNCPAKTQTEQPAPLGMVECLVAKKDWPRLEKFLQSGKWGDREFLRLAYLSRTAEEQKETIGVEARWRAALRSAEDRIGALSMLLELSTGWHRPQAREEVLWVIADRCPREKWALRELQRSYEAQLNTRGLNKVCSSLANRDPKDVQAVNDLAATSMLLKVNLPEAYQLAREIYTNHPTEPFIVSTYAYSLHLQGRSKEALGAMEKLKPEALEQPAVALYYGLLLNFSDKTNEAQKYFTLAGKANLLPEEKNLLATAAGKP
jgi:predicted Zn-dependent protease